jgi:hypothetical protein
MSATEQAADMIAAARLRVGRDAKKFAANPHRAVRERTGKPRQRQQS